MPQVTRDFKFTVFGWIRAHLTECKALKLSSLTMVVNNVCNNMWILIEVFRTLTFGKTQIRNHIMSTDPGPENTFWTFFITMRFRGHKVWPIFKNVLQIFLSVIASISSLAKIIQQYSTPVWELVGWGFKSRLVFGKLLEKYP